MCWGGLRGAVGMSLALEVYESQHFCTEKNLGPKVKNEKNKSSSIEATDEKQGIFFL